ncbi:MAG TPA: HEAT repeat domain-containing protein, partial [Rhodoglobus sp.]|nr:HEAT repeat domain-containing protein [Rhodoglobus sp.]
ARGLDVAPILVGMLGDETARVRAAAARALGALGTAETVDDIRPLLKDPEIDVRRGAQQGIDAIRSRFPG